MSTELDLLPGAVALGRQMTVEFYDCAAEILSDAAAMERIFLEAAEVSGAHVVNSNFHSFEPQGVSGVVVISESHFAVHAWPEHDYAAVDLFTCGDGVDFDIAVKALAEGMRSGSWIISSMVHRGIVGDTGIERLVPVVENQNSHGLQLSWAKRFEHSRARAMSCCIDIYNCTGRNLSSEEELRGFADQLAGIVNGAEESGEWGFSIQGEDIEFARTFARGHLNGFVSPENQTVYLDIFADGFYDPREAAEFAVRSLGGLYYRMQPQVRQ